MKVSKETMALKTDFIRNLFEVDQNLSIKQVNEQVAEKFGCAMAPKTIRAIRKEIISSEMVTAVDIAAQG